MIWKTQTIAGDTWPGSPLHPDYAKEVHFDFDFAASPILIHGEQGQDVLVAGQKSGEVFGFEPQTGKILWRKRLGRGGTKGGVHFSLAAEGRTVFVPLFDSDDMLETISPALMGPARPGIHAVDAFTGEVHWSVSLADQCTPGERCQGYSAAITAIPGVLFAGRYDGVFQAFDSANGKLIWEFGTAREFSTLNGDRARGSTIDGPGPLIVDGMVYLNSGYGLYGGQPGNVLLAFSVHNRPNSSGGLRLHDRPAAKPETGMQR